MYTCAWLVPPPMSSSTWRSMPGLRAAAAATHRGPTPDATPHRSRAWEAAEETVRPRVLPTGDYLCTFWDSSAGLPCVGLGRNESGLKKMTKQKKLKVKNIRASEKRIMYIFSALSARQDRLFQVMSTAKMLMSFFERESSWRGLNRNLTKASRNNFKQISQNSFEKKWVQVDGMRTIKGQMLVLYCAKMTIFWRTSVSGPEALTERKLF